MFTLQHIHKSFEDKIILNDISFAVNPGEVIALIGENGAGKTTLLKVILGELQPDTGTVSMHHENIGYVPQEASLGSAIKDSFEAGTEEWQIDYALELVGLDKKPKNTKVSHLSGGQKTRLAFAKVLASEPTTLLLDEPTNNLDRSGLVWLEQFIKSFRGSIVLVSHDRSFINRVATKVVELHNGKLTQYGGDYDFYKAQKEIERQTELAEYEQFMDEKKRLTRLRNQKASMMQQTSGERYDRLKGIPKMAFNAQKNAAQRSFGKQLKAIDSRLEQLDEIERPESVKNYKVALAGDVPSSKLIIKLENIHKSYGSPVLSAVGIEIRGDERLHISGPNGSGKTTLLKIAAGLMKPDVGEVVIGAGVGVGYFSQDVDGLDYKLTGFENLQLSEASSTAIYREARSLGLTEKDLRKKPSELSRGQQAKLGFAKLLLASNQLLILDEPTNHLDIPTRERIEAALQNYDGAMLVASHDEYFLQQIEISRTISLDEQRMKQATLVLLCGLPGAGKTTLAKKLAKKMPAIIMSPDQEMYERGISFFDEKARAEIEAHQWQRAKKLLKEGHNVVLENGFWGRSERDQLRREAHSLGARIELHYLDVPFDELWRRVDARNKRETEFDAPLTRERLEQSAKSMQAPDAAELSLFDRGVRVK